MPDELPHRKAPCDECPWRKDTELGKFPAERYEALAATSEQPHLDGLPDVFAQPMFGCHKGTPGRPTADLACAGWLAMSGLNHIGVRLALIQGRLPEESMFPGPRWPELYGSYGDMASANRAYRVWKATEADQGAGS